MSENKFLRAFVEEQYGKYPVGLHTLGSYDHPGRIVCRVDLSDGLTWVLRAYRDDGSMPLHFGDGPVFNWLIDQARVLLYLSEQNYPAPEVVPSKKGELVGRYRGWCGLMITFIRGSMMQASPKLLRLMAATLGYLHTLTSNSAATISQVGFSWWHPERAISQALSHLASVGRIIEPEWRNMHQAFCHTLHTIQLSTNAPQAIIHGDCWAPNAVQVSDDHLVLVDWEWAGYGMAVLDLGELLMECHADPLPGQSLQIDPLKIASIIEGYCQQRIPTSVEVALLGEAIRFGLAAKGAIRFAQAYQYGWDHRLKLSLERRQARLAVSEEIASLARAYLTQHQKETHIS